MKNIFVEAWSERREELKCLLADACLYIVLTLSLTLVLVFSRDLPLKEEYKELAEKFYFYMVAGCFVMVCAYAFFRFLGATREMRELGIVTKIGNIVYGSVRGRAEWAILSILLVTFISIAVESLSVIKIQEGVLAFILPVPIFVMLILWYSHLPIQTKLNSAEKKTVRL
ncbi:MAG TPA: hypothetical protein ACFYD5_01055 [Candidatus Tripitaka sp. YC43]